MNMPCMKLHSGVHLDFPGFGRRWRFLGVKVVNVWCMEVRGHVDRTARCLSSSTELWNQIYSGEKIVNNITERRGRYKSAR